MNKYELSYTVTDRRTGISSTKVDSNIYANDVVTATMEIQSSISRHITKNSIIDKVRLDLVEEIVNHRALADKIRVILKDMYRAYHDIGKVREPNFREASNVLADVRDYLEMKHEENPNYQYRTIEDIPNYVYTEMMNCSALLHQGNRSKFSNDNYIKAELGLKSILTDLLLV